MIPRGKTSRTAGRPRGWPTWSLWLGLVVAGSVGYGSSSWAGSYSSGTLPHDEAQEIIHDPTRPERHRVSAQSVLYVTMKQDLRALARSLDEGGSLGLDAAISLVKIRKRIDLLMPLIEAQIPFDIDRITVIEDTPR